MTDLPEMRPLTAMERLALREQLAPLESQCGDAGDLSESRYFLVKAAAEVGASLRRPNARGETWDPSRSARWVEAWAYDVGSTFTEGQLNQLSRKLYDAERLPAPASAA